MKQIANRSRSRPLEILLSPGFLAGLALLLLNDFYLKQAYGNFLTGKLSDFSGLFIFSLFLSGLFPTRLHLVHIATAVSFLWWKSPLADGFIDAWNSIGIMAVGRTVDYSDYIALLILPLSYAHVALFRENGHARLRGLRQAGVYLVLVVSVFAFAATSSSTNRDLTLPEIYTVRENRVDIEQILLKHERVKDLLPSVRETTFVNGTNVKLDQPRYDFDFTLAEKTCNSPLTRMSFMVIEHDDYTELAAVTIRFECGDYRYRSKANFNSLDRSYIEQARTLFRQEILSKLTPVELNDKTPRTRP